MTAQYVLALDQGTTSTRALIVDSDGQVVSIAKQEVTRSHPEPGWVEQDAWHLWESCVEAMSEALKSASLSVKDIAAIGVTNQRETVVVWDRSTGEPVGPAIGWQDRRTTDLCAALREEGFEERVAAATGLTIDPYFSGTKLWWLLDVRPELRIRAERGEIAFGTVDSWLIWNLTGGRSHVTDFTNASRTLLFNIRRGRWDRDLCDLLGVPTGGLPEVVPSSGVVDHTDPDIVGAAIPIAGIAGDQQSSLFGQWCIEPGIAKNTYGTGGFLLAPAAQGAPSRNNLLLTLTATSGSGGPNYAYEGSVFSVGATVQWLRDELRLFERTEDIETLAASVPDTGGVSLVPAFAGLGAPHWDPDARGLIIGLTQGTGRAQIARAALEGIAASTAGLIEAMNADLGAPIGELRVDGGAAKNDLLMQIQADLAGIPVIRPRHIETTAMGVAYLAGLGIGLWNSIEAVSGLWQIDRVFDPSIEADARSERMAEWRRAVERAAGWARRK